VSDGKISSILSQILGFIGDKPWKAIVVILAIALGAVGWVLYEKRDELIEAWLTPSTPELKVAEIPTVLETLAAESGADVAQVWSVDLPSNSQHFIAARRADGQRPVIPNPRRLPVFSSVSDVRGLIDVLDGQPACVMLSLTGSPLARRLAERGMVRGCAIPISPNRSSFLGVIYLAWEKKPLDEDHEKLAVGIARDAAAKLWTGK